MDVLICVEIASMKNEVVFVWESFSVFLSSFLKEEEKVNFITGVLKDGKSVLKAYLCSPVILLGLGCFSSKLLKV